MKSTVFNPAVLVAGAMFTALAFLPLGSAQADLPVSDAERASLPTTTELAVQANDAGNFTILVAALQAAGLVDVFNGDTHYTVFAPTDEAFLSIPQQTLEAVGLSAVTDLLLPENVDLLTAILLFHVTPGDWYAGLLPTGVLRMLDNNLAGMYWEGEVLKIEGAPIAGEVVTQNGVVHIIDAVILPPLQ
jgi:uncharacterized surface protein with fasciclin (FAS1) repeats